LHHPNSIAVECDEKSRGCINPTLLVENATKNSCDHNHSN